MANERRASSQSDEEYLGTFLLRLAHADTNEAVESLLSSSLTHVLDCMARKARSEALHVLQHVQGRLDASPEVRLPFRELLAVCTAETTARPTRMFAFIYLLKAADRGRDDVDCVAQAIQLWCVPDRWLATELQMRREAALVRRVHVLGGRPGGVDTLDTRVATAVSSVPMAARTGLWELLLDCMLAAGIFRTLHQSPVSGEKEEVTVPGMRTSRVAMLRAELGTRERARSIRQSALYLATHTVFSAPLRIVAAATAAEVIDMDESKSASRVAKTLFARWEAETPMDADGACTGAPDAALVASLLARTAAGSRSHGAAEGAADANRSPAGLRAQAAALELLSQPSLISSSPAACVRAALAVLQRNAAAPSDESASFPAGWRHDVSAAVEAALRTASCAVESFSNKTQGPSVASAVTQAAACALSCAHLSPAARATAAGTWAAAACVAPSDALEKSLRTVLAAAAHDGDESVRAAAVRSLAQVQRTIRRAWASMGGLDIVLPYCLSAHDGARQRLWPWAVRAIPRTEPARIVLTALLACAGHRGRIHPVTDRPNTNARDAGAESELARLAVCADVLQDAAAALSPAWTPLPRIGESSFSQEARKRNTRRAFMWRQAMQAMRQGRQSSAACAVAGELHRVDTDLWDEMARQFGSAPGRSGIAGAPWPAVEVFITGLLAFSTVGGKLVPGATDQVLDTVALLLASAFAKSSTPGSRLASIAAAAAVHWATRGSAQECEAVCCVLAQHAEQLRSEIRARYRHGGWEPFGAALTCASMWYGEHVGSAGPSGTSRSAESVCAGLRNGSIRNETKPSATDVGLASLHAVTEELLRSARAQHEPGWEYDTVALAHVAAGGNASVCGVASDAARVACSLENSATMQRAGTDSLAVLAVRDAVTDDAACVSALACVRSSLGASADSVLTRSCLRALASIGASARRIGSDTISEAAATLVERAAPSLVSDEDALYRAGDALVACLGGCAAAARLCRVPSVALPPPLRAHVEPQSGAERRSDIYTPILHRLWNIPQDEVPPDAAALASSAVLATCIAHHAPEETAVALLNGETETLVRALDTWLCYPATVVHEAAVRTIVSVRNALWRASGSSAEEKGSECRAANAAAGTSQLCSSEHGVGAALATLDAGIVDTFLRTTGMSTSGAARGAAALLHSETPPNPAAVGELMAVLPRIWRAAFDPDSRAAAAHMHLFVSLAVHRYPDLATTLSPADERSAYESSGCDSDGQDPTSSAAARARVRADEAKAALLAEHAASLMEHLAVSASSGSWRVRQSALRAAAEAVTAFTGAHDPVLPALWAVAKESFGDERGTVRDAATALIHALASATEGVARAGQGASAADVAAVITAAAEAGSRTADRVAVKALRAAARALQSASADAAAQAVPVVIRAACAAMASAPATAGPAGETVLPHAEALADACVDRARDAEPALLARSLTHEVRCLSSGTQLAAVCRVVERVASAAPEIAGGADGEALNGALTDLALGTRATAGARAAAGRAAAASACAASFLLRGTRAENGVAENKKAPVVGLAERIVSTACSGGPRQAAAAGAAAGALARALRHTGSGSDIEPGQRASNAEIRAATLEQLGGAAILFRECKATRQQRANEGWSDVGAAWGEAWRSVAGASSHMAQLVERFAPGITEAANRLLGDGSATHRGVSNRVVRTAAASGIRKAVAVWGTGSAALARPLTRALASGAARGRSSRVRAAVSRALAEIVAVFHEEEAWDALLALCKRSVGRPRVRAVTLAALARASAVLPRTPERFARTLMALDTGTGIPWRRLLHHAGDDTLAGSDASSTQDEDSGSGSSVATSSSDSGPDGADDSSVPLAMRAPAQSTSVNALLRRRSVVSASLACVESTFSQDVFNSPSVAAPSVVLLLQMILDAGNDGAGWSERVAAAQCAASVVARAADVQHGNTHALPRPLVAAFWQSAIHLISDGRPLARFVGMRLLRVLVEASSISPSAAAMAIAEAATWEALLDDSDPDTRREAARVRAFLNR